MNNILSTRGINLARVALSSEKKLVQVLDLPFEELVRIELRVLVTQIRSLNQSLRKLVSTIAEEGAKLEGHKNLTRIKGIGNITGAILLSIIGDVNDFPDEHRLASHFGIVPRVSNSNQTEHSGHIHKHGSKLGRTALVQSALIRQPQSVPEEFLRTSESPAPAEPLSRWRASFSASSIER